MLPSIQEKINGWLLKLYRSDHVIRGLPAIVVLSPHHSGISADRALERLESALDLIERYQPMRFRRLMQDFNGFVIRRDPTRGAYFANSGFCLVDLTFLGGNRFSDEEIAATIIHESIHARLYEMGCPLSTDAMARHERLCRQAELAFARALPNGELVAARAAAAFDSTDEEVAPDIDWEEAWQHVALADIRTMSGPRWFKRLAARRRGIDPSLVE